MGLVALTGCVGLAAGVSANVKFEGPQGMRFQGVLPAPCAPTPALAIPPHTHTQIGTHTHMRTPTCAHALTPRAGSADATASAPPPGSAPRTVPIQHAVRTSRAGSLPSQLSSKAGDSPSASPVPPLSAPLPLPSTATPSTPTPPPASHTPPTLPPRAQDAKPLPPVPVTVRLVAQGGRGGGRAAAVRTKPPISMPPMGMPPVGGSGSATAAPGPPQGAPATAEQRKAAPQGGLEALAAARAQGFASLSARAAQQQQQQQQQRQQQQQQQGEGIKPRPPASPVPQPPQPPQPLQPPQPPQPSPGGAGPKPHALVAAQPARRSTPPGPFAGLDVLPGGGLPPLEGSDPSLYRTGVASLPQPNAEGRALCARLARELVGRKVTPGSSKWRPQTLVNLQLLEGVACEYHHHVNTSTPPTSLSEAVVEGGAIRCRCCRPLVGESDGPQVRNARACAPACQYVCARVCGHISLVAAALPLAVLCGCTLLTCLVVCVLVRAYSHAHAQTSKHTQTHTYAQIHTNTHTCTG